jgi:hypothetical protein
MRRRRAVATALLVVMCGCSQAADDDVTAPESEQRSTAPESTAPEPTESESTEPQPTEPQPTESQAARPPRLADALLPATDVPVDASGQAWTAGPVAGSKRTASASACQRVPLLSIGVTELRQRRYQNAVPGQVLHTVAAFADDDSARRAYAVLEVWLRDCAETLSERGMRPGTMPTGLSDVAAPGLAGWAAVFYEPARGGPDAGVIEAHAIVVDDETLSWLVYRSIGQDYNYETGQAPPERAAPVMAQRLRTLR